jgi:hypothetical protein
MLFHEFKTPSKVEIFKLESIGDDLFGTSKSDKLLDISNKYPKLPLKESSAEARSKNEEEKGGSEKSLPKRDQKKEEEKVGD